MKIRFAVCVLLCCACPASDDSQDGGGEGSESTAGESADTTSESTGMPDESGSSGGLITNGCGTFDPGRPGDSVIPQDPDDPEIISACTTLCIGKSTVPDCSIDPDGCLEECKMRSCDICPGTLAPLVECETENFDATGCTCESDGVQCAIPEACADEESATGFCGG